MDHDDVKGPLARPPLRTFIVRTKPVYSQDGTVLVQTEDHTVTAHLVFNNELRGEGIVFRRYYEDSTRTEKVAEFELGSVLFYKDVENG